MHHKILRPTEAHRNFSYNSFRFDNKSDNPSGGLIVFTHLSLNCSVIPNDQLPKYEKSTEFACLTVQVKSNKKFLLGFLYNHPPVTISTYEQNCRLIEFLMSKNKNFYLLGDFNINCLDLNHNITRKFHSFLKRSSLTQAVKFPTRISTTVTDSNVSKSLIDLFVTNSSENIQCIEHNLNGQMADHRDLIFTLKIRIPKTKKTYTRTYRDKRNYVKSDFELKLVTSGITDSSRTDNIVVGVTMFNELFLNALNGVCPIKTGNFKHSFGIKPNTELDVAFTRKTTLLRKLSKNNDDSNLILELRLLNKKIDTLLSQEKKNIFSQKFSRHKGDPKKLWKDIKEVAPIGSKNSVFPINEIDISLTTNFNQFLCSVGKNVYKKVCEVSPSPPNFFDCTHNYPQFSLNTVDIEYILRTVSKLKPSESLTSDGISLKFLKESLDVLALTITQLINTSIVTNCVPPIWKTAIVTPIHKCGDNCFSNFRPISIICVLAKILELVVANQLVEHCETHNIFNPCQFGYRKKSSTGQALAQITEEIFTNLDNHRISLLILLDLSKAFDSIPHSYLIQVLKTYNLYVPWFQDYLSGRTQCTKIGSIISDPLPIEFGVPQGSVLGPILFILYINGIKEYSYKFSHPHIKVKIIQYADDTQLLLSCEPEYLDELRNFATTVTEELIKFFNSLKLATNIIKTLAILFASKSQLNKIPPDKKNVIINGKTAEFSTSVKTLGVTLDFDMKFKTHVNNIYRKVFNKLVYINKCRGTLNFCTRKLLVEHCAFSHLYYCREIWGHMTSAQNTLLQKLISFGSKVIFCRSKYDHSSQLIEALGFLSTEKTNAYFLSGTAFKCINNLSNINIPKILNLEISHSQTRNSIILPRPKTSYLYQTILFRSSKFWLQLPNDLKNITTFHRFKKTMKTMLLNNQI